MITENLCNPEFLDLVSPQINKIFTSLPEHLLVSPIKK